MVTTARVALRTFEQKNPCYEEDELTEFAGGYDLADVYRLLQLNLVAQEVLGRCEADLACAIATGRPYEYPDWRTAVCWFYPKQDECEALHRRVVELEAEIANLKDRVANPIPQQDSKRWFEQELLAMAQGIVQSLLITVADGQTWVQGRNNNRHVFLRAAIPRVFADMSSTAWSNIKGDRFDKSPVRADGGPPIIKSIPWDKTLDVPDVAAIVAQVPAKLISAAALGLDNDRLGFYSLFYLKRLLRKKPTTLRISARGILGAEIVRNDIIYKYFICATGQ